MVKIHLGEEVLLKLIHFSPIFDQILLIYLSLDLFLPIFKNFGYCARIFYGGRGGGGGGGEEIQKSKSGGGKDIEEFELYLPVSVPE